jgi:hydroxymethylglutaryl-CoA lyase
MDAGASDGGRVRITDVSPRDGLQNERAIVDADSKASLVLRLAGAGVDEVEVGSFVSPKWVPQLADAEEVFGLVADGLAGWSSSAVPVLSALVPNERGFDRALGVHRMLVDRALGGLKIAFFTAASEAFSQRNSNASVAQSVERFGAFASRAVDEGMGVRVYVSCAVACPFSGRVEPGEVVRVVEMVRGLFDDAAWALVDVDLGDTIGAATPGDIERLVGAFGSAEAARLTLHLHDTRGRAGECVKAALSAGVRSFDGAAGGLGGCPYASAGAGDRAPGNVATGTVVEVVTGAGFRTGVDRARLAEAGAFALGLVGREAGVGGEGSRRG